MISVPGVLLAASLVLLPALPAQADALDTVRQLYASADYESALSALDRLTTSDTEAPVAEIERYRALCLMALGRPGDAEVVMERIVRLNPRYQPDEQEAPRVRAAFALVRARVLPVLVRNLYLEAKATYDRKDYAAAVPAFERTLGVLESVESSDPALDDLRTLAVGFLDLSRAASAPPPPPPAPPAPEPEPEPLPLQAATLAPPPVVESAIGPQIVTQTLPPWNPAWFGAQYQAEFHGAVEVVIDTTGAVTSARILEAIHPAYDVQLLDAATRWRYVPAQRNGRAVVSTKRVDVVLRPRG